MQSITINPQDYTILVVDDIMTNVILLQAMLKHNKYKTITATSGTQAIEKIKEFKPDLVLLDVMMPDMNGYEVAKRVKSDPETNEIPIIFVTALNDPSSIVEGFKNGCNDYVTKPFNAEEVLTRIVHQLSIIASHKIIVRQTEELKKVIEGRDRLYSVIAHDLRSPLGSMQMALNMMVQCITPEQIGADMHELLTSTGQTAEELFSLLDNLLKWTKNQLGKLNMVLQEFDFAQLISGVCDIMVSMASLNSITLKFESDTKAIVSCDIDMTKTVIRNLILNALKFSPNNSTIVVRVYTDGNDAICDVVDQGIGISDENQELLRNSSAFTTAGARQEEGSGLGLQLCREFTQKNNGKFWFKSKLHEGSTFSFSYPIVKAN